MSERLPLTQQLAEEHMFISEMLDLLQFLNLNLAASPERRAREILALLPLLKLTVGEIHHHKEEEILFPVIDETTPVHQGGPRCGHFMNDLLLEDIGRELQAEAKVLALKLPPLGPFIAQISKQNSPLMISVQEHWAGKLALDMLDLVLKKIELGDRSSLMDAYLLASRYERMMRSHIEKEDTCLFVLADQFIGEDRQLELLEQSKLRFPDDQKRWEEAKTSFRLLSQRSRS